MLSRAVSGWLALALGLVAAVSLVSCEKVPLLAPTGSTITLTSSTNVLSANGSTTVIAQVLEAAGVPPHSGTRVTFTTSLGRMDPAEASTDVSGRATATFVAGGTNGTATIAAISGGATTGTDRVLRIAVGSAAVGRVTLDANPTIVSSNGGSATLTAFVLDVNGNPLVTTPVSFTTTTGSLSTSLASTDANGRASTVLTTTQEATVTATVGVTGGSSGSGGTGGGTTTPTTSPQSATATVRVSGAPTIAITLPGTPPSRGLGATYTFSVTPATANPNPIRSVTVDWGDRTPVQSLGTVSGSQAATHVYNNDGTFLITATVTDVLGNTNVASTSVTVIPIPGLGIVVNLSTTPANPRLVTANVQITVPTGLGVESTRVNWGDSGGRFEDLSAFTGGTLTHTYSAAGTYTVTISVTDTAGRTYQGSNQIPLP